LAFKCSLPFCSSNPLNPSHLISQILNLIFPEVDSYYLQCREQSLDSFPQLLAALKN